MTQQEGAPAIMPQQEGTTGIYQYKQPVLLVEKKDEPESASIKQCIYIQEDKGEINNRMEQEQASGQKIEVRSTASQSEIKTGRWQQQKQQSKKDYGALRSRQK